MKVFARDGRAALGGSCPWRAVATPTHHLQDTVTHEAWWCRQFQRVHCNHPGLFILNSLFLNDYFKLSKVPRSPEIYVTSHSRTCPPIHPSFFSMPSWAGMGGAAPFPRANASRKPCVLLTKLSSSKMSACLPPHCLVCSCKVSTPPAGGSTCREPGGAPPMTPPHWPGSLLELALSLLCMSGRVQGGLALRQYFL